MARPYGVGGMTARLARLARWRPAETAAADWPSTRVLLAALAVAPVLVAAFPALARLGVPQVVTVPATAAAAVVAVGLALRLAARVRRTSALLTPELPGRLPWWGSADVPQLQQALTQRRRERAAEELSWEEERSSLDRQRRRDALTGLHNRGGFDELLSLRLDLAQRAGRGLSLVLADLDFFKQVNDTYGHPAGDAVLVELAGRIVGQLRSSPPVAGVPPEDGDVAGRVGGEEFAVLVDADTDGAVGVADRIRRAVAAHPFTLPDGTAVELTVSLGVAPADVCGYDLGMLYESADVALYQAKARGRNGVVTVGG